MGIFDEDDHPLRKGSEIVIGQPLDQLSIHELQERVEQLKTEIERVQEEIDRKGSATSYAEKFFK